MADKPFQFICGADDYLVNRVGRERHEVLAAEITDEFSREIVSGFANNVGEVEAAVNRFQGERPDDFHVWGPAAGLAEGREFPC
jgi:hypothetical protein